MGIKREKRKRCQFDIEEASQQAIEEVLYVKDQHATGNRAWQLKNHCTAQNKQPGTGTNLSITYSEA